MSVNYLKWRKETKKYYFKINFIAKNSIKLVEGNNIKSDINAGSGLAENIEKENVERGKRRNKKS